MKESKVCLLYTSYRLIKKYLEQLTDEQTLVVMSGHPLGLFHSHRPVSYTHLFSRRKTAAAHRIRRNSADASSARRRAAVLLSLIHIFL